MKNLSKVLAVVLAFAMALSMVSFAAYTDVEAGADCEEAVTVLSALEILKGYEDGSFKPDATITRAEFATVVIRLLGLADTATGGATIFTDVAADHWANGAIALAAQQGIVNGYGDGRFGPEDPVKYQEAIKMVVAALGYTPMADANGGYPGGYQVVASQKGILAGISGAKADEPATRGVVAQLAYNSLTVPLMEQTGYGTQTNFQTVNSLLLNKLGVTKFEGAVTGTVASGAVTKAGKVKVEYDYQITAVAGQGSAKKYDPADSDQRALCNPTVAGATDTIIATGEVEEAAKALIDVAAILYVKNADTDDAELVCIIKNGNKNETVSFMSEDINEDETNLGSDELAVYTDKDAGEYEEYELNISKVYVNGREKHVTAAYGKTAGTDIAAGDIDAVLGYYLDADKAADITLLSRVEDEFNVAYITAYTDIVVDGITARTYRVSYDNAGVPASIILDETDKNYNFTIYKDGEVASFDDIAENDVLSIAGYINASKKLEYGDVYITSEKVEGKVTGRAAGTTNEIAIDGTTYKTTATVKSDASLGDTAVFYVNARGVLVGIDKTASGVDMKYGFASYIYYDTDAASPVSQIRMLTADGVWTTIDIASTVKLVVGGAITRTNTTASGYTWIGKDGVAGKLGGSSETKSAVNKVVAYDLNSEGKIDELYLVPVASSEIFEQDAAPAADQNYIADTDLLGAYYVDDSTVIFSVTSAAWANVNTTTAIDEDSVSAIKVATLSDREDYFIQNVYNTDDDTDVVAVMLGKDVAPGIEVVSDFFVVTADPMETTNEAGEAGYIISGLQGGEEATLFLNTEDVVSVVKKVAYTDKSKSVKEQLGSALTIGDGVSEWNFAKGDVLLYNLNAKGEAHDVIVLVDASDVTTSGSYGALSTIDGNSTSTTVVATESVSGTEYKFVFGYAKELKNGKLVLTSDDATDVTYSFASTAFGTSYDKFTTAAGKVMIAEASDIVFDAVTETPTAVYDGDMVFAKVSAGTRISEFVIVANDR